MCKNLNSEQPI